MHEIERAFAEFLEERKKDSNFRELHPTTHPDARTVSVDGRLYINCSSNDYLGLAHHPAIIEAAQEAAGKYGAGSGASRLVTGNIELFDTIENKIAAFKNKEAGIVMVSGFQANASILPALFDKKTLGIEPLVFADKLNHASMHLGCAAAGIKQIRYAHNDVAHLESLLQKYAENPAPKFILTESVFSMDGDIAPLDDIANLAQKYDCFTIADEAHAGGVLGKGGRGLADKADMVIGTFSKAFGSFGAYIACSKTMKEYLVNKCAGLIYATALPPAVLGSINAALDIIPSMEKERTHLQTMAQHLRSELQNMGYDTGASQTQIVPVIIGASDNTIDISTRLKEAGFWATAIRPPTVPDNAARIRFALSAAHTEDDIAALIDAFRTLQKQAA